mgnify:CR=1 FL=1
MSATLIGYRVRVRDSSAEWPYAGREGEVRAQAPVRHRVQVVLDAPGGPRRVRVVVWFGRDQVEVLA